jgi:Rrf2 family protein
MAVHVLTVLAYKEGDRATSSYLAKSVNTNPVVIRRLLSTLQKANLVDTCKGAGSGSRLDRSPGRITLAEVYQAVEEDDPFTLPPGKPNPDCPVGHCIQEALQGVFSSAEEAMIEQLRRVTVADIIESVRRNCSQAAKTK